MADFPAITHTTLVSLFSDIASAIRAKKGISAEIIADEFPSEIMSIPSGGAEITDGIVVKARNESGYATEVEHYGNAVETYQFGHDKTTDVYPFRYLESVTLHGATSIKSYAFCYCNGGNELIVNNVEGVTTIGTRAFMGSKISSAVFPNVTSLGESNFRETTLLTTVSLPKLKVVPRYAFYAVSAIKNIQIGSVGYGVTSISGQSFLGMSSSELVITIYTKGTYVDTAITNTRTGAANATIIIKASEDTTYDGVSYAAGDTIVTSEVE